MRRTYRKKQKKSYTTFAFICTLIGYYTYFVWGIEKAIMVGIIMLMGLFLYKKFHRFRVKSKYLNSGMKEVDTMSGTEFENFLLAHFEKLGYKGNTTQASNDFGADLVLKKEGDIIVIQAKRHKGKIGIKAVQEVSGAINFYGAMKGIVVTNNYFTPSAVKLAAASKIELWDRNILSAMMKAYKKENRLTDIHQDANGQSGVDNHPMCPKCNSKLVERNGNKGKFYGCSNYPKCTYTQSI